MNLTGNLFLEGRQSFHQCFHNSKQKRCHSATWARYIYYLLWSNVAFPLLGVNNGGLDSNVVLYQYDPKAPDDLFETFKSNWTRITYEQKKQMLKTKNKSMESCFDFVMNMRQEQTLFGNC